MNRKQDLAAVREFRAHEAEPTDLAVTRTRHRVIAGLDGPPVAARSGGARAWLAIAGSAAAIVAVVGLVVAIQQTRAGVEQAGDQPAPLGQPAQAQADPSPTLPPFPAVDMSVTPVRVPAGGVLYVRRESADSVHEMWLDVEGGIPLQIVRADNGIEQIFTTPENGAVGIAEARAALQTQGPSLARPTPAYLDALPTDPASLLAKLADEVGRSGSGQARADLIFKGAMNLLGNVEPLLSPQLRTAFLAALASAPDASVDRSPRTFGGHDVYLVQQVSNGGVRGFAVDTGTGRIVGYFAGVGGLTATNSESLSYAVVGAPGQRP